jgi:hypothetical protein
MPDVVPVLEHEVIEPEVEAELAEHGVRERALGQVAADSLVPELLGRLDLDGHAA